MSNHPSVRPSAKVLRDGTKLLGSSMTATFFSVIISVVIIRILSKEQLAVIPILDVMTGLIMAIADLGLIGSALRLVPEALERGNRSAAVWLMRTALTISVSLTVLLCAVFWLGQQWLMALLFGDAALTITFAYLLPALFFGALAQNLSLLAQVAQRFGTQSLINLANRVVRPLGALGLFFPYGFEGFALGLAIGPIIGTLIGLLGIGDLLRGEAEKRSIKGHLRFSLPYYLNGNLRFALMNADQLTIALLLSPSALATYYVARRFSGYLFTLIGAVMGPILPQLIRFRAQGEAVAKRAIRVGSRYLFLSLVPIALGSSVIAYSFIPLVAGERYMAAAPMFAILCLAEFAYCVFSVYGMGVFVFGRPRDVLTMTAIAGLVTLALTVALSWAFEGMGTSIARLLAFCLAAFTGKMLVRIRNVDIEFDWRSLGQVMLACCPMLFLVSLSQWLYFEPWLLPGYIALGALVLLPFHSRLWTARDLELVQDFMPRRLEGAVQLLARLAPRDVRKEFNRPAHSADSE